MDRSDRPTGSHPLTIPIPCSYIRLGDVLIIQGRPCQVIRISTSAASGRYRYLGVDLFTKRLYEEDSSTTSPADNVTIQTMLGPHFKQYNLLSIQDGKAIVPREDGTSNRMISIIDQQNFRQRLTKTFEFNHNFHTVVVIVVTHGDDELVIDMKVVHDIVTNEESPELHRAAALGQVLQVQELLDNKVDVNQLNILKQTALFGAIRNHRDEVINLLLRSGTDINVADQEGRTALDLSIANPATHSIAHLLLKKGASPTEGISQRSQRLLSACASGDVEEVQKVLRPTEANPNDIQDGMLSSCDRLGFTPLHEAASFGHFEVLNLLIERDADIGAVTRLSGDSILHAVIDRGRSYRKFFKGSRGETPRLHASHIDIVELLLRIGVSSKTRRRDGRTVQGLISTDILSSELTISEKCILQRILILLFDPTDQANDPHADVDEDTIISCDLFSIQMHYQTWTADPTLQSHPMGKFLCKTSDADFGQTAIKLAEKSLDDKSLKVNWRWAHLPLNNTVWVKSVAAMMSRTTGPTFDAYSRSMGHFIDSTYHEVQGTAADIRMRKAQVSPLPGSHATIFSLVVPYFESEDLNCHTLSVCENQQCRTGFNTNTITNAYISHGYPARNFHKPCTLDESYYLSLTNFAHRNKTQVITKYASRHHRDSKRILMVHQMWIWKVDSETIISAFPDRQHPSDGTTLRDQIADTLSKDINMSSDQSIIQMLQCALGFVDGTTNAGLEDNVFDIFAQSIAHWAEQEYQTYEEFHQNQENLGNAAHLTHDERALLEQSMCNISKEVGTIREIKDIIDELGMIRKVLEDQKSVVDQLESGGVEANSINKVTVATLREETLLRIVRVEKLLRDASSLESSLNHLLDIKQKQSNLDVARDTRKLADEAKKRALDGEWQANLLFVFTVVTVIFAPISFLCAFLAIPSRDFPKIGDDVAWTWWHIFAGGLITELATFMAVGAYWTFPWQAGNPPPPPQRPAGRQAVANDVEAQHPT